MTSEHKRSGWRTQYAKLPLSKRLAATVVLLAVALLVVWPKDGNYYPEGNWLFGPLWLLCTRSSYDKEVGAVVALLLLPLIAVYPIKPGLLTGAISALGVSIWIGFGAWLAMLATV